MSILASLASMALAVPAEVAATLHIRPKRKRKTYEYSGFCSPCNHGVDHSLDEHDDAIFAYYGRQGLGEP